MDEIDDPEVEAENAYKLYLEFDNRNKDLQVSESVKENEKKKKKDTYIFFIRLVLYIIGQLDMNEMVCTLT